MSQTAVTLAFATADEAPVRHRRGPRAAGTLPPWATFPLLLPWSVSGTFLMVTMGFFLSNAGVSVAAVAVYMSAVMIPDTFKVLWAPLVDATLGPRRWHAIGVCGTIAGLCTVAFVPVTPANMPLLTALAIACGIATTFVHLTTDIFVTYDVASDRKGRAGGWGSASNLGGGALGGGLAIWLAQTDLPHWSPAVAVACICAAAAPFALMPAPRPPAGGRANPITGMKALLADVVAMVRSPRGAAALFLFALPIGSVGLMSLVPVLARDWHAGAKSVVFVNGIGGGLVQIVGALIGGRLADRFERRRVYFATGAAIAAILFAMALGPRTPLAFIVFALLYLIAMGAFFAAFVAVEFEAVGRGGAAATKCMLLVCVSNVSSDLMAPLDGQLHDRFSVTTMLMAEVAIGVGSIALFAAAMHIVRLFGRRRESGLGAASG